MKYLILIAVGILGAILGGFTISQLWFWFVTPLGVPAISIAQGIGLNLVAVLLTMRMNAASNDDIKGGMLAALTIVVNLLFLLMGWIVHFFM